MHRRFTRGNLRRRRPTPFAQRHFGPRSIFAAHPLSRRPEAVTDDPRDSPLAVLLPPEHDEFTGPVQLLLLDRPCPKSPLTSRHFGWGVFRPKTRVDVQFVHGLNNTARVVRQDFAEGFVHLRDGSLATHLRAELRLNHAEDRLDVRPRSVADSLPSSSTRAGRTRTRDSRPVLARDRRARHGLAREGADSPHRC